MLQRLRWTSIVAFLLICLPCVQATADKQPASDKPAAGGPALCYDAWVLEISPREAERILGARAPVVRRPVRKLRACAARWLRDRAQRGQGVRVRTHRTGCIDAGASAPIEDLARFSYIQDYDVEISMGSFLADPVIGTINWGVKLTVHNGGDGTVRMKGEISALVRPVPEFDVDLSKQLSSGPTSVTIQLPELRITHIEAQRELAGEDWYLVGSRMHFESPGAAPKRRYVLLRVGPKPATQGATAK